MHGGWALGQGRSMAVALEERWEADRLREQETAVQPDTAVRLQPSKVHLAPRCGHQFSMFADTGHQWGTLSLLVQLAFANRLKTAFATLWKGPLPVLVLWVPNTAVRVLQC